MDLFDCLDNPVNGFENLNDNLYFKFSYPKSNYHKNLENSNLDQYIISNIKKHGFTYFSFLYEENLWINNIEKKWSQSQQTFYELLCTYTKLHFVIDNWNYKYIYNLTYLSKITQEDKNIIALLANILNKEEMLYWIKNKVCPTFDNYILKTVGYSLESDLLLGNIPLLQFSLECLKYPLFYNNIDNSKIFKVNTQNNLLGYLFVCLNVKNEQYHAYINDIYDRIVFLMKNSKKDIITEWISNIINQANKRIQLNYDYLDNLNNGSDNKLINLMNVLLLLWKGGNSNKERIFSISTNYIKSENCTLKWKDDIAKSQMDSYIEDNSFYVNYLTKCFFILHRCCYVTLTPLFLSYNYYYKKFKDIESYLKILNLCENRISSLMVSRLEKYSATYYKKLKSIEKKIVNFETIKLIKILIKDTSLWINKLIDDNKLDEIHSIPDSFYYMIIDYINFDIDYSHLNSKTIESPENLIKLVYRIIGTSEYITNPNLKCKLFNSVLCRKENIEFISRNQMFQCEFYKERLVYNCLELYNSIPNLHGKIITRYNIVWFLSNIIRENPLFFNSLNKHKKVFDKFIFIVLSETNDIYDVMLKYYKIVTDTNQNTNYLQISQYIEILKTYTEFFTVYIKFISAITNSKLVKYHFLKDVVIDKFTNSLIYIINNFTKNFIQENSLVPKRYLDNIQSLVMHIVFIFRVFYDNEDFINSFSREDTIYNKELTLKFIDFTYCYNPSIKNHLYLSFKDELNSFSDFMLKVNDKINSNLQIPDEDIPDEFLDPIMNTLIKNPIIIPNTNNTFMDKTVIYKYLVTENKNPFTREKLNKKILDDFNLKPEIADLNKKLKNKIDNWLNEYISLKKNTVSNIKKLVINNINNEETNTDTSCEGTAENSIEFEEQFEYDSDETYDIL